MTQRTSPRVILLAGAESSRRRLCTLLKWTRALVPAAVLVAAPGEARPPRTGGDALELDADGIPSGPLALADALVRAAAQQDERAGPGDGAPLAGRR